MVVLKGDGEIMRSLCGMLVSGGDRCGCRNGLGELRKEEGESGFILLLVGPVSISQYMYHCREH